MMEPVPGGGLRWPIAIRVGIYQRFAAGDTCAEISRAYHMPYSTVDQIIKDPETAASASPLRAGLEKKALAGRLVHIAHRAMDEVTDEKLENCSAPQAMLVAAIALDKMNVIDGAGLRGFGVRDILSSVTQELEVIKSRRLELMQSVEQSENHRNASSPPDGRHIRLDSEGQRINAVKSF